MSLNLEVDTDYTIALDIAPKNKQIPYSPLGYCLIIKSLIFMPAIRGIRWFDMIFLIIARFIFVRQEIFGKWGIRNSHTRKNSSDAKFDGHWSFVDKHTYMICVQVLHRPILYYAWFKW